MKEYKAITLGEFITAREISKRYVLLFVPSDETEVGDRIQANEIYLSRESIARLHAEFPLEVSDERN